MAKTKKRRKTATQRLREVCQPIFRDVLPWLWTRQGGLCVWCKCLTFCPSDVKNMRDRGIQAWIVRRGRHPVGISVFWRVFPVATIEHITPLGEGGAPVTITNLAAACADCNSKRAGMTSHQFLAYLGIDPGVLVITD